MPLGGLAPKSDVWARGRGSRYDVNSEQAQQKISRKDEGILVFWKKLRVRHSRLINLKIFSSKFFVDRYFHIHEV